jgi:hypothetical protein
LAYGRNLLGSNEVCFSAEAEIGLTALARTNGLDAKSLKPSFAD